MEPQQTNNAAYPFTITRNITAVRNRMKEEKTDFIITEDIYKIRLNGEDFATLACLPENLMELGVGFLFTEGIINKNTPVQSVFLRRKEKTINIEGKVDPQVVEKSLMWRFITTGCGASISSAEGILKKDNYNSNCIKIKSNLVVESEIIKKLMQQLNQSANLFKITGAVHTAALASDNRIICSFEDISRHNAVDKVAGYLFLQKKFNSFQNGILFSSGRISIEIVMKCIRAGIPVIVSRTAPMAGALEIAEEALVCVIGFARGNRMNIYTHPWRIR